MFTGIIESSAEVLDIRKDNTNVTFTLRSALTPELKVDQSVSHNGVCLTVEKIQDENYEVTAIKETLLRTNMGQLKVDEKVNLERCLAANGRLDGHIVQGHVDCIGKVSQIEEIGGSWNITVEHPSSNNYITVEKGSICVNGVSLTVVNSNPTSFSVSIIPYTWEHTNFHRLVVGSEVNLEFDILGKYIQKLYNKQ